jgi:hypothetical protein
MSVPAEPALPAGDDLLRDGPVAKGQTVFFPGVIPDSRHRSDKFVPGYARDVVPGRKYVPVSPKHSRAAVRLDIPGAYAAGFHLDEDLILVYAGYGYFLILIIIGSAAHNGVHGFRDSRCFFHVLSFPFFIISLLTYELKHHAINQYK